MHVIVVLSREVAPALHGLGASATGDRVRAVVAQFGLRLEPLHPGTTDPSLQQHFTLEVVDQATAAQVVAMLRQTPSVEAAYVKPADEPA
jgi:hypothetical protein